MEIILNIALVILPAGAVLYTTYLFLKKQSEKEIIHLNSELKKERQNFFLPSRVESYQRAVLLMERIHPNSLVMRLHNPGLPAQMFQAELLKAIREEYDHNVAQQIFISLPGWEMVRNSKEETIKIINLAGKQMTPISMSSDLAAKIFEIIAEVGQLPSEIAVDYLKKELQQLF
ncbi:MAG: hypothetical protein HYR91_00580 [Flavobacteriia bacterium]|nr:hypothetical protein [Flavobacteriia bacterium]